MKTDNCVMFLEDKKFFDSGDDELIREFLSEERGSVILATNKVADFWSIYRNGKPPKELRWYVSKIAWGMATAQSQIDEEINKLKSAGLDFLK